MSDSDVVVACGSVLRKLSIWEFLEVGLRLHVLDGIFAGFRTLAKGQDPLLPWARRQAGRCAP
jgi:hypothetical protein